MDTMIDAKTPVRKRLPPPDVRNLRTRLWQPLFATPLNAILTALTVISMVFLVFDAVRWVVLDSVWVGENADACSTVQGACWAVISHNWRLILFGNYPIEEQWRLEVVLGIFIFALILTIAVGSRNIRFTFGLWVIWIALFVLLMRGGIFGLPVIESDRWGGILITIFVFLSSIALGFPAAILLALGRTGRLFSARAVSTFLIEVLRPVPLIAVLFCSNLLLPMVLPEILNPGKLGRVIISMGLFYACYQAEVIRAGLRIIPFGQFEAANARGLSPRQIVRLVSLPQALRLTMPATVNLVVVALKDTSLIITVGLFDFAATANQAFSGNAWRGYSNEVYLVVALVYLAMTLTLTWLGHSYERRLAANG